MNDDDDEFVDAVDTLDNEASPAKKTADINGCSARPDIFVKPATPQPTVIQPGFSTPVFQSNYTSQTDAVPSTSRRDRLSALRNRMREEFGARESSNPPMIPGDVDNVSMMSDTTSLHSWHRRVLAGPDTVIVLPSDSVSTRAMSTGNPLSPAHSEVISRIYTVPEDDTLETFSPEAIEAKKKVSGYNSTLSSPVGPPPSHPPPPLPDREKPLPVETRCPPPLPPRNPSIRLPEPVAKDLVARLATVEDDCSFHTPTAKSIADNVNVLPHSARSQRLSTTSNDSVSSIGTGEGSTRRARGHTKSNSLDRGLTLAKSLKAGPFPPPSNKTNSLTRQSEDGDDGEEEVRNTEAADVIQRLTTGLLQEKSVSDGLEPIAGSSSVSSHSSHQSKPVTQQFADKLKVSSAQSLPASELKANSAESLRSEINRTEQSPSVSSSIDPIARDIERRMSMKRGETLNGEQMSDDGQSDRFSNARSTVDHAKSFAKNYGNVATGFFRGAFQKVKEVAHVGVSSNKGVDGETTDSEGEQSESGVPNKSVSGSIVRPRKAKKGPFDFEPLRVVQEINNEHTGAIWCVKFSICGRLIATAGQDAIIRVWAVKSHIKHFQEMRERYQQKVDDCGSASDVYESTINDLASFRPPSSSDSQPASDSFNEDTNDHTSLLAAKPFAVFKGHTADILDVSWSKNYFILSSGMDRTVKLWHLSRGECLCCFQHVDFVTCVAFLPKDDRYFLSGSLDGKLRLWYIPDKKVAVWNEVQVKFITAITFVKNGKFAVVGTYNGRCYFYTSDQLKYHTVVDVRSTRGKNARGHKVTGLAVHGDKLLVTSNDSRIRMYDVRDMALTCKFRGAQNEHSQIRAAFSPDGRHIVCGSEDKFVYLWRTSDLPSTLSVRKDRNAMWERVRAHTAPVSVAIFAPKPQVFMSMLEKKEGEAPTERSNGHIIVSADLTGSIKIMVNRPRVVKSGQSMFFDQE